MAASSSTSSSSSSHHHHHHHHHHSNKLHSSSLLLFLFASLSLLLLACHVLSLVFLAIDPPLPQPTINKQEHILVLHEQEHEREEDEAAKLELSAPPTVHYLFPHSPTINSSSSSSYSPPPNAPNKPKLAAARRKSRRAHNAAYSKLFPRRAGLNTTAAAATFSARAAEFFSSSTNNATTCAPRFFMTWISSPSGSFGPRELLSVESLFKSHPAACLLILSSSLDSAAGAETLRPFRDGGFRVAALSPDPASLLRGTPARGWLARLRRGEVDPGPVPLGQNLSNLLRLALLYKYGGVYVDTDVVVLRSVLGLRNVLGAQAVDARSGNWTRLNNAVMAFDRGHPLLLEFLREFAATFDGSRWGHNGPYLVSRVAMRVLAERPGLEFGVLPPAAFYPVDWSRIRGLFSAPRGGPHSRWVSAKLSSIREGSFAVHLWNRQSSGLEVEEGSIVGRLMSDCCLFCNSSSPSSSSSPPRRTV